MNIRTFFLSVCLFLGLGSYGQVDLQRPLPADPNTVVGKLPNGITYYIRHNEEPKDRASFYIIRNVGALLENDDQNGLAHFLELLFQSVSLVLDTLRTFFLIVLSILGPLSFAISVYDGFHNTMIQWICQYVSIYLWLPISDLFSSVLARIQVLMIEKDIAALSDPTYVPDVNNSAYIIFMLIAIVGYFTIPTVSTWVIQASGAGNYGKQVNSWSMKGGRAAAAVTGASVGHVAGKLRGK